jgi:hypothetical protein
MSKFCFSNSILDLIVTDPVNGVPTEGIHGIYFNSIIGSLQYMVLLIYAEYNW